MQQRRALNPVLVYAGFVLLTAAAASVGALYVPGAWYAGLQKPSFNPPDWLFAPVWTALYVMIAIAGARVWRAGAAASTIRLWNLQLVLNAVWTWLFFGLHQPGLAFTELAGLWLTILAFIVRAWPVDRLASFLFIPYLAWVTFAGALNLALWRLN